MVFNHTKTGRRVCKTRSRFGWCWWGLASGKNRGDLYKSPAGGRSGIVVHGQTAAVIYRRSQGCRHRWTGLGDTHTTLQPKKKKMRVLGLSMLLPAPLNISIHCHFANFLASRPRKAKTAILRRSNARVFHANVDSVAKTKPWGLQFVLGATTDSQSVL